MTAGEGQRLRALRLEALRDAPEAFTATLERDEARPMSHWDGLAGGPGVVLVAGDWAGMAGIFLRDAQPTLWGMWVAPAARRQGAGRLLVEAAAEWARVRALERLFASVMDPAPAARALYDGCGFVPTGETWSHGTATEIGMALELHPRPRRMETERLVLRVFESADLAAMHDMRSREDVVRWLYEDPSTIEDDRARLARRIGRIRFALTDDALGFAVDLDGTLVGDVSLHLRSAEHHQGEIGFVVHPDHWGRGYATEAATALLDLGFETFGLHRIAGRTEARNTGSALVLERIGMQQEGHLVENELVKGEWQSEVLCAIRYNQPRLRK